MNGHAACLWSQEKREAIDPNPVNEFTVCHKKLR
jgi:hypothetical protein